MAGDSSSSRGTARGQAAGRGSIASAGTDRLKYPDAICFDAFGTLLELHDPAGCLLARLAAAGVVIDRDLAVAAFAAEATYYRDHALSGGNEDQLAALRRHCARILGERIAAETPHELSLDQLETILLASLDFRLTWGVADCLRTLAGWGVRLAVVSNWDCSLRDVLTRLGIREAFVQIIASAEVGYEKPDPRTWDPALEALGRPEVVWHIGDEPAADVGGARAAGLTPVLIGAAIAPPGIAVIGTLAELPPLVAAAKRNHE